MSGNLNLTPNSGTISTAGLPDSVPAGLFQSFAYAAGGVGQKLSYQLPVADGSYRLVLYVAEPYSYITAGQRVFDVALQGAVVDSNVDIVKRAGGAQKAIELSYNVTASGGQGISLDLINKTAGNTAVLGGIELQRLNPQGTGSATVDLQLSTDNGATWVPIASGLTMDRYGRGSYNWTVNVPPTAATAR